MEPPDDPELEESLNRFAAQLRAHIDARFQRNPEEARKWLHLKLTRLVQAAAGDEEPTSGEQTEPSGSAP